MTKAQLVLWCPFCGEMAAAATLHVVGKAIDVGCSKCGSAVHFNSFGTKPGLSFIARPSPGPRAASAAAEASNPGTPPSSASSASAPAVPAEVVLPSPEPPRRDAEYIDVLNGVPDLSEMLALRYRDAVRSGDQLQEHQKLVKAAVVTQELDKVGRLYRNRLGISPDDPVAKAVCNQVLQLATAQIPSTGEVETLRKSRRQWILFGAALLVLFAAMLVIVVWDGCPSDAPPGGGGALPALEELNDD